MEWLLFIKYILLTYSFKKTPNGFFITYYISIHYNFTHGLTTHSDAICL